MRTEDLIDVLGRGAQPVDRVALLGTRPDLATTPAVGFVAAKLVFGAAIFSVAAFYLVRVSRPELREEYPSR